jgi:hypothetical protein
LSPAQSTLLIANNDTFYGGNILNPEGTQNLLTQKGTGNEPAAFTLIFDEPVAEFVFTRPAMYASSKSGLTYPAWRAIAFDAAGNQLSLASEQMTRSFTDVPAKKYFLSAPAFEPIATVRFESDPRLEGVPFAAFSAVVIERIEFRHRQDRTVVR